MATYIYHVTPVTAAASTGHPALVHSDTFLCRKSNTSLLPGAATESTAANSRFTAASARQIKNQQHARNH